MLETLRILKDEGNRQEMASVLYFHSNLDKSLVRICTVFSTELRWFNLLFINPPGHSSPILGSVAMLVDALKDSQK